MAKPLVAVGGPIAIAVVLFVNIKTQSYELVATPTSDICGPQADNLHSSRLLQIIGRNLRLSCNYTTLPVNSEIFTKDYALPYTIRSAWQQYADGTKRTRTPCHTVNMR